MDSLAQLHNDIDGRVDAIRTEHSDWLCRMGCDGCCRRLAEIPNLTAAEWEHLKIGLEALPKTVLVTIGQNMELLLANPHSRPIVCPLLNLTNGTCRVYDHRPTACRTYGFYVQRDQGLYCKDIEEHVAAGHWNTVVWGNQNAIDRRLGYLGKTKALTEWFALDD